MQQVWRWKRKIDSRCRIQLPAGIVRAMRLKDGDVVDIAVDSRGIILLRAKHNVFEIESCLADLIQLLRTDERKFVKNDLLRQSLLYLKTLLEQTIEEQNCD